MALKHLIKKTGAWRKNPAYVQVLLIALAFALMVVLSSYFMTNIVRNQLVYNAEAALDSLETNINTDLKEPRTVLGNQSECVRTMILRGDSREEVRNYLNVITKYTRYNENNQLTGFDGLFGFFDVFGGVMLDGQDRPAPENYDPTDRPWYKEAVAAGGEIVFLHPHIGVVSPAVVITYTRALFDNDGNLLGVIAMDMELGRIKEYVINANLGKVWFGILLNAQYEFIFHIDTRLEGTKFEDMNSDTARAAAELKLGHDVSEFRFKNYQNVPSIIFIRKLENGWYLGIDTPEGEYFREVKRVRLILIVLGTFLAAVLSAIQIRAVSEKLRSDEKLEEAKEQAVRANRAKSEFLARMSHEIRSPMNVILGITEIQLEKADLRADTVEALDKIHNSGYMLLNVINDILDLSKIESGRMELMPVDYDIASLINDTVQLNIMRFDTKPILFFLKIDEHTPATLNGDDLRIKQILNNIISNAFKYTESGEVGLAVSAEVSGAGSPVMLILRVTDTGYGMSQDQLDKLFDDYSRFNMEANRKIEGTGLGISITKRFVELMKGEITVKSELGKGSEFTIRLPQGYVNSTVLGKEGANNLQQLHVERKTKPKKAAQIVREYMPYGKVLVVDDMEPNLYVVKGLLSSCGLSIDTTTNGPEAIEKIKNGMVFDIIFMDHFMPEMDGIEATKILRSLGYTKPIVALTANALAGQAEIFMANGFDGFIPKPIDTRMLNSTLNKFIRDRYPAETVEAARRLKEKMDKKADPGLPDLSSLKALVVDDFLPNLNVAGGMLRKYKMQADCVLSGQEAVDRIKSEEVKYDIIFMDHLMPEMDGIEATRLIRSLGTEYANKIPIVAVTTVVANEAVEKEQMFLDNGFQAVIPKPLSMAKLDTFIKSWLGDKIKDGKGLDKEKNMKIDIPGVQEEKIMELYDGDMDIFLPVLRSYLSVIPVALEQMSNVSAETLKDYTIKVHGVKSTSDSIGAEEARKMALDLEMLAKAGDLSGVLAKNDAFLQYGKTLLGNIKTWLAKYDAK
jgi:signal transduction histidine kinase/CheY-like chemotaxis protein